MASKKVILETFAQFKELTGREYKLVETYNMENADIAIVCLGTTYETAMVAIEELKAEGINAGVVAQEYLDHSLLKKWLKHYKV